MIRRLEREGDTHSRLGCRVRPVHDSDGHLSPGYPLQSTAHRAATHDAVRYLGPDPCRLERCPSVATRGHVFARKSDAWEAREFSGRGERTRVSRNDDDEFVGRHRYRYALAHNSTLLEPVHPLAVGREERIRRRALQRLHRQPRGGIERETDFGAAPATPSVGKPW